MEHLYTIAALWLGLAVISSVLAYHLRISIALVEICVWRDVAAVATHYGKFDIWEATRNGSIPCRCGAVLLTFLAGAELEPEVVKKKSSEK